MADDDDDDDTGSSSTEAALVKVKMERRQLRAELKAAQDRIGELEKTAERAGKEAEKAAGVAKELEQYKVKEADWTMERSILAAGIEADGVQFVRMAWSSIPEADRPKDGIKAWLGERDKLPKGVQAYLPAAPSQQPNGQPPAPGRPPPSPNAGTRQTPPGEPPVGRVSELSSDQYRAQRASIYEQLGIAPPRIGEPPQKQ